MEMDTNSQIQAMAGGEKQRNSHSSLLLSMLGFALSIS
jgi:hypothetical protein